MSNHQLHFSFDPLAKDLFGEAFPAENENVSFYVFQDYLNEGQLRSEMVVNFDQARAEYYLNFYQFTDKQLSELSTPEKEILHLSTKLSNGDEKEIILWMANNELDVLGYFFILHYLRKHTNKISVINISGLPFIDKNGKLFFPKRISELDTNSINKALLLRRNLSAAEIEMDSDEWKIIRDENAAIRILAGNKKIKALTLDEFDETLKQHYQVSSRSNKNVTTINDKLNSLLSERFILKRASALGLTKKEKVVSDEDPSQMKLIE